MEYPQVILLSQSLIKQELFYRVFKLWTYHINLISLTLISQNLSFMGTIYLLISYENIYRVIKDFYSKFIGQQVYQSQIIQAQNSARHFVIFVFYFDSLKCSLCWNFQLWENIHLFLSSINKDSFFYLATQPQSHPIGITIIIIKKLERIEIKLNIYKQVLECITMNTLPNNNNVTVLWYWVS